MTRRLLLGNTGSGGLRISKPGYDVINEPYGSRNIAFDSRLSYLGSVLAAGLIQCGGAAIPFPTLNYVPIVQIKLWDGTDLRRSDFTGKTDGTLVHTFIPAVAIVTTSSIQVVQFTFPFYNTAAFYNANGQWFFYSVYAIG